MLKILDSLLENVNLCGELKKDATLNAFSLLKIPLVNGLVRKIN